MLLTLAGLLVFWSCLCWCGIISLHTLSQRRRLWFGLAPLLFGLIGVMAQIPISMQCDSFRLSFDAGWFFLVPLFLGGAGIVLLWRARYDHAA